MSHDRIRIRLHDVRISGDVTDPAAVLAAVERAVADAVRSDHTRLDPEAVEAAVSEEITRELRLPDA